MSSSDNNLTFTAAELRELVKGRLKNAENEFLPPWTGMVEDDTAELLAYLDAVGDNPIMETELGRRMVSREAPLQAARAVEQGKPALMRYLIGNTKSGANATEWDGHRKFLNLLSREALVLWMYGPPGTGKTNFAGVVVEEWRTAHRMRGTPTEVATNLESWEDQDHYINDYDSLKEWINPSSRSGRVQKFFLFDDSTKWTRSKGKTAEQVDRMEGLISVIRKGGGNLGVIGHREKAAGPGIRDQATVIVSKEHKKRATFYRAVDLEGRPDEKMFELQAIPKAGIKYDDKEGGTWDWCADEEEGPDAATIAAEIVEEFRETGKSRCIRPDRRPGVDRLMVDEAQLKARYGVGRGVAADARAEVEYLLGDELDPAE